MGSIEFVHAKKSANMVSTHVVGMLHARFSSKTSPSAVKKETKTSEPLEASEPRAANCVTPCTRNVSGHWLEPGLGGVVGKELEYEHKHEFGRRRPRNDVSVGWRSPSVGTLNDRPAS